MRASSPSKVVDLLRNEEILRQAIFDVRDSPLGVNGPSDVSSLFSPPLLIDGEV